MQPQITSPAPQVPARKVPPPHLVHPKASSGGGRGRWGLLAVAFVIIAGAAVWYFRGRTPASPTSGGPGAGFVRTAAITKGNLDSTIRLTGVTAAENFASLIAPQMRGSRGGRGRSNDGGANTSASSAIRSQSGGNSSPGSSSSGGSSNMSSALRAATSRFSGGGAATSSSSSSSTSSSSSSGSTSSSSSSSSGSGDQGGGGGQGGQGGGGGRGGGSPITSMLGGGGGNDFQLVLQKLVKAGVVVKKGDEVAEFDRQNMLMRVDDYRVSVSQAEASLKKLKADLDVTRKAHEKDVAKAKAAVDKAKLDMKTTPVLSNMDAERIKLALEEAEARYKNIADEAKLVEASLQSQVRNSELDFEQTKIELRRSEANADRMVLKAPISGLTVMQTIVRGSDIAQVQAGDQLFPGIMFMSIVDPNSMVVNASVNQADVERLRIGAKAKVRFDAYPDLELPARVYSVGGVAKQGGQRANFVKEIPVKLKLEKLDNRVIPDLTVSADIVIDSETQEAALAPVSGVFRDGPDKNPYVFVQGPQGWVRREVQIGVVNYVHAAVRSGLKPGEVMALDRPPQQNAQAN